MVKVFAHQIIGCFYVTFISEVIISEPVRIMYNHMNDVCIII